MASSPKNIVRSIFLFSLLAWAFSGVGQQLVDVEVKVVEVSHNWDCGTADLDVIQTGLDPEPRWKVFEVGNPLFTTVTVNPGTVSCGTIPHTQTIANFLRICDTETITLNVQSWEEDCGNDNVFENNCLGNGDDVDQNSNFDILLDTFTLSTTRYKTVMHNNANQGYSITFSILVTP